MQYGKAISDAFSYARHSKAALLYAGFTLGAGLAVLALLLLTASALGLNANPLTWARQTAAVAVAVLVIMAGVIAFLIGSLAVTGTIIRNTAHAETLSQSWNAFSPRLGSMIGVALIASVISFASSFLSSTLGDSPGLLGSFVFILHLVISLALTFFLAFAEYAVALEGRSTLDAIGRSVGLAKEKPASVLLAIIVSTAVSLAIILVALAAVAILLALAFLALRIKLTTLTPPELVLLGIAAVLAFFGLAIAHVVQLHVMSAAFRDATGATPVELQVPTPKAAKKVAIASRKKAPAKKPASKSGKRSSKS